MTTLLRVLRLVRPVHAALVAAPLLMALVALQLGATGQPAARRPAHAASSLAFEARGMARPARQLVLVVPGIQLRIQPLPHRRASAMGWVPIGVVIQARRV
jgi:hypothetical protein